MWFGKFSSRARLNFALVGFRQKSLAYFIMRRSFIASVYIIVFFLCVPAFGQQVFKTTSTSVIGYLEYLPSDYHSNSDKYPIVIFLHGIGERGTDTTDPVLLEKSIPPVANLGPPKYAKNGQDFPFILISPQLKKSYGSWPSWYVLEVINHVKQYLRVDERRIHITGLSLGGGGAWVTAQENPKLFASLSPVCGSQNSTSKACGITGENLPVWAFHGDKDTVIPLSRTTAMVDAINACVPAPSPVAKLSVYAGVAHDSWERAYAPNQNYHSPNVYGWMMSYSNTINGGNHIPVANAGSDKTVAINTTSVSFAGSATDKENAISKYNWVKISGPAVTQSGQSTNTLNVSSFTAGTYVFRLQVTDNAGNTDSDYVKLTVTSNIPPVANAGSDKVISLPTNSVTLTGAGKDTDGTIVSYSWQKIAGGAATITNAATATATVQGLASGSYKFRLTVKDNGGATHTDDVDAFVNNPPSVSVGADIKLNLPANAVSLTGTASDADGTIVSYSWKMTTGTVATLAGTSTPTLNVSGLIGGNYVFRLTVKDNHGASKFDDVMVLVNTPPVANAGADKIIHLPTNTTTITGSGTDSDGTVSSYSWTKISGGTATLSNVTTPNLTLYRLEGGAYTFRLTVRDNRGGTHSDEISLIVNTPPVVNAGADKTLILPINSISLPGAASDSDGSITEYSWSKLSGGTATLTGASTSTLSVSGMTQGEYIFRLTVKDNSGGTKSDDVKVIVRGSTSVASFTDETIDSNDQSDTQKRSSDPDAWVGKEVVIFNGSGSQIFKGQWQSEMYAQVIQRGLYVIDIYEEGKRISQEKVFKL